MADAPSTKVLTPDAIASYPNVLNIGTTGAPRPQKDGKPSKYGITLIFPAGTDMSAIYAAELAAAKAKWGEFVGPKKNIPIADAFKKGILSSVIRLSDENVEKNYPEGSTFLNARTDKKPGLVWNYPISATDKRAAPMTDEEAAKKLYPGCIVRASLNAFVYERPEKKGVSFGLNNIQWRADGERIDGRAAAQDEFEGDLSAKPADLSDME